MCKLRTILVTGGAGYIGSHCIVSLIEAGYSVIALDNFTNSVGDNNEAIALKRVEQITGKSLVFYRCDLLNIQDIEEIFKKHTIEAVIHFAAMKAVGESMQVPLLYYKNNIVGMINLLEIMEKNEVYNLVFSSSCTVYGEPKNLPITENDKIGENITNVYGKTKYFIEEILKDISSANSKWNIIALRYFNPVGAHPSGLIGEDPTKHFTNLMPYISQVAIGKKEKLIIFGNDYNTPDGTGIRDYIHVMDLANGHAAALNKLSNDHNKIQVYNLGTGRGVSVMELIKTFERVNKVYIPYEIHQRRVGDISAMYADASLAEMELGWKAQRTIEEMCIDFWKWQTMNPDGYKTNIFNGSAETG